MQQPPPMETEEVKGTKASSSAPTWVQIILMFVAIVILIAIAALVPTVMRFLVFGGRL